MVPGRFVYPVTSLRTRLIGLISLTWLLVVVVFTVVNWLENEPTAATMEARLREEFSMIAPYPEATQTFFGASHQPGHAAVDGTYQSHADYTAVRGFYDAELSRHGWQLCREETVLVQGKDVGIRIANYSKGEEQASLQYNGGQGQEPAEYALNMNWGYNSRCSEP